MMKKQIQQIILYVTGIAVAIIVIAAAILLAKGGLAPEPEEESESQSQSVSSESLYLILSHDTVAEKIAVYSYETGEEAEYSYSYATRFLNRYGDMTPAIRFVEGKVVKLGGKDSDGVLTSISLAGEVWEQTDVKRFSIDEDHGVFMIGDKKYSVQEKVVVFSNGEQVSLSSLSKNDVLSVVGLDSRILAINVTTGHGTLSLTNTSLFNGSLLKLNENIYAEISPNMKLELPEGNYTLTVANDGWGSSRELVIARGETTEIDLDTMKGEGRKKGMVSFKVNAENIEIYIDQERIDHSQPVEVTYGTHRLEVRSEGFEPWKRYLVVNSPEATIQVELELANEKEEESESESKKEDTEAESESETERVSESETESDTENTHVMESTADTATDTEFATGQEEASSRIDSET